MRVSVSEPVPSRHCAVSRNVAPSRRTFATRPDPSSTTIVSTARTHRRMTVPMFDCAVACTQRASPPENGALTTELSAPRTLVAFAASTNLELPSAIVNGRVTLAGQAGVASSDPFGPNGVRRHGAGGLRLTRAREAETNERQYGWLLLDSMSSPRESMMKVW